MAKKKKEEGAPAYMAQYTALMTILLAFFILLNTLSKQQESGFHAGIGDVQGAFGFTGGLGLNQFFFKGRGGANPYASKDKSNPEGEMGLSKSLVMSSGGTGTTDSEAKQKKPGKYISIRVPYNFPDYPSKNATKMPQEMSVYLQKIVGMAIALLDVKVTIRCFSVETPSSQINRELALKRAVNIMQLLNKRAGIPLSKLAAAGYPGKHYFKTVSLKGKFKSAKQAVYLYIFVKNKKHAKK